MRLKRKRDAEMHAEMLCFMTDGVLSCDRRPPVEERDVEPSSKRSDDREAKREEAKREEAERVEAEREEAEWEAERVRKRDKELAENAEREIAASAPAEPDHRLPFQRYKPTILDHYVGNNKSREDAVQWLRKWKTTTALQRPKRAAEAMMLFYGHSGTGKSVWARYVAMLENFSIATYTPGDGGSHDVQKLDFWLKSQPARNLKGQPMAVILDDVDELFRSCPAAKDIRVSCPIIATAAEAPEASLRTRCSKALKFSRIGPHNASKIVLRLMPRASQADVKTIVERANGDIRQIMLRSCFGFWNVAGAADAHETSFGCAQETLNGTDKLGDDFGEDMLSQRLVHHNFNRCCCDDTFFETYTGFLQDAATLNVCSATRVLPFAARCWRTRKSGPWMDELPRNAREERPVEDSTKHAEADDAKLDEKRAWVSRKPRFKSGMQFACSLLAAKLGDSLALEARKKYRCGDLLADACLSPGMRLAAEHVDEIAGYLQDFA